MPRYARFAAALALVSTTGCYESHVRVVRADGGAADASVPDVGSDARTHDCTPPLPCTCPSFDDPGTCEAVGLWMCCAVVGPLAPPDLA